MALGISELPETRSRTSEGVVDPVFTALPSPEKPSVGLSSWSVSPRYDLRERGVRQ